MTLGARAVYPIYVHRPYIGDFPYIQAYYRPVLAVWANIGLIQGYTACTLYVHTCIPPMHAYTCIYAVYGPVYMLYIACISGIGCIPCI